MGIRMDGQVAVVTGAGQGAVFLCSEQAPSRVVLAAAWEQICDETDMRVPRAGFEQTEKFALQGAEKLGMKLS